MRNRKNTMVVNDTNRTPWLHIIKSVIIYIYILYDIYIYNNYIKYLFVNQTII